MALCTSIKLVASLLAAGASLTLLTGCQPATETTSQKNTETVKPALTYPETKRGEVIDQYFDVEVADPYRWLEDDRSAETEAWVSAQNATTQQYLKQIPYRQDIAETVKSLLNYTRISAPFEAGDYLYYYKNDGLQDQSVLYRKKGDEPEEVFIDPNTFSQDGTVSLASIAFSEDGSLAAYLTSTGGSDWREAYVIDTNTKQLLDDKLENIKFSGLSWYKNEGFYYSSYDKPEGSELSAKTDQHKVYYHKVGTAQSADEKVYGHTDAEKYRYVYGYVTEDQRHLIVETANATSGNRLLMKALNKDSDWVVLKDEMDTDASVIASTGESLIISTNLNAPNTRVVAASLASPDAANWQDVIAETDHVLSASTAGGYIFAEYMVDAISKVVQFDMQGNRIRDIAITQADGTTQALGSVTSFDAPQSAKSTYFEFENYNTPSTAFKLDIESGDVSVFYQPDVAFNSDDFVSTQVFYTSKDGTRVPMMITHRKDIKLDGKTPTMLYGYGGFNVSLTPRYSSTVAAWLKLGGIYAVANIRGGGEYGKAWHRAGTQMQKQNVFDDFIAAAQYLIDNQYTSSDYLALRGGSNGGLLVAAVLTQRPDIAKVALPAVGVLDMLRYHTFTAGAGWAYDYGTAEQSEAMFTYLLGYSPVHNVKRNVDYPATLITTADHDDRVVPAHSFKFAAELQHKNTGPNPTLIRIETDAGHGAGTPVSKTIEQYADIYGFTLYNMGIESLSAL